MYRSSGTHQLQSDGPDDPILDKPFTFEDLVLAVASLAEHIAPGADCILSNDLTLLLHADPFDPQFTEENKYILRYILSLLNSFWRDEKVLPVLKQTIIRPILKKLDSDPTDPSNYRPISLLNPKHSNETLQSPDKSQAS